MPGPAVEISQRSTLLRAELLRLSPDWQQKAQSLTVAARVLLGERGLAYPLLWGRPLSCMARTETGHLLEHDHCIIRMPPGLPGFEQCRSFIFLARPAEEPFLRLQAVGTPGLAFLVKVALHRGAGFPADDPERGCWVSRAGRPGGRADCQHHYRAPPAAGHRQFERGPATIFQGALTAMQAHRFDQASA